MGVGNNPALSSLTLGPVRIRRNAPGALGGLQIMPPLALPDWSGISTGVSVDTVFFTLPAAGLPGFTLADVQAWKQAAPGAQAGGEWPNGAGGIRKCL